MESLGIIRMHDVSYSRMQSNTKQSNYFVDECDGCCWCILHEVLKTFKRDDDPFFVSLHVGFAEQVKRLVETVVCNNSKRPHRKDCLTSPGQQCPRLEDSKV